MRSPESPDTDPVEYDRWFDEHPTVFATEVRAVRALVPEEGRGLAIGVGTGRYAQALGLHDGVDPSPALCERARARGLRVQAGSAADLPYAEATFDVALLMTPFRRIDDVEAALSEAARVLRPGGALVIGMVDGGHPRGLQYAAMRADRGGHQTGPRYSTDDVVQALRRAGFASFAFRQTFVQAPGRANGAEPVRPGSGDGAFVVIRGRKPLPAPREEGRGPDEATVAQGRAVRHNRLTGRDVIIAPSRSGRPRSAETASPAAEALDPSCPFCRGNEPMLPYVVDEYAAPDAATWQTRVVPNKYAALDAAPPAPAWPDAFFTGRRAWGRQEVIIESPDHHVRLADLSVPALATILQTYQQRCRAVRQEDARLIPFVFRNQGARAGASLHHPHSQLIATRHVPAAVAAEERRARAHYRTTGRCLVCDLVRHEGDGPRVVRASAHFLAVVPFAAEVPCEILLVPRTHAAAFTHMGAAERTDCARVLRDVLQRLRAYCADPAYNYFLRTPLQPPAAEAPHLHWYLRLLPRTKQRAGFERSTDVQINPSAPEADAAGLRAVLR